MPPIHTHPVPAATRASRKAPAARRIPVGAAVRGALLGLLVAAPVMLPAPAAAEAPAARSYEIPAGPLGRSLNRFAATSAITLSFDPALVEGRTAPALAGEYSVEGGLRALLAGSGLVAVPGNGGGYRVQAVSGNGEGPLQLGPITVEGWRPTRTLGYRPGMVSSTTKTPTPIGEVPSSVSVVTSDVIDDQNATSVREALRNVPGVRPGPNPANVSVQEEVTIRGFESALVHINGVERRSTGSLSTANIESVEVLKGPFSVLYGRLSPGGMVNIQTKRPQRTAAYRVDGGLAQILDGQGTEGRGVVDATGPVTEDGSVLYRFIASAEGGSSFIEDVDDEKYLVNPSFSFFGADDALRVDADFSYLRNDETFLFGIPSRGGEPDTRIDYDAFLGADDSEKETEDYTAELRAEYALTADTSIDGALTYHRNNIDFRALRPFGPLGQQVAADDTVRRSFDKRAFKTEDRELEVNGIHDFTAGAVDWRLLVGADVRRTTLDDTKQRRVIIDFDNVDVLSPDNGLALPSNSDPRISVSPLTGQEIDSYGFYVQAEAWLHDRIKLLAGFRYDNVDYSFESDSGFSFTQEDDEVSPRAAVLFKATPDTSLYASYTSSFEQSLGFDPDAPPLEPTKGRQWELGLKQDFFDGRLFATVSAFRLTQENIVQPGPTQTGEAETDGLELELNGRIAEKWRVTAAYSYLDNEITDADDGTEGNRLANSPEHAASAFLLYDVFETADERLSLGGGVFYTDETFTSTNNSVEMPDYTTVDLTGQYAFSSGGVDLQLRGGIKNVFDEEYYYGGFGAGALGSGISFRGEPRSVWASLSARF